MLTQPEQYALTEASYTVVRLLQHFDTLENADPLAGDEPLKLSNLTMSHDRGVWIKLGSSEKAWTVMIVCMSLYVIDLLEPRELSPSGCHHFCEDAQGLAQ